MFYRFGNMELDAESFKLRRDGQALSLQRKVFDVLHYLVLHRDRVVSKNELLEAVWRDENINEAAVPWSISHLRNAIGQRRGSKEPIETVHGRGYRFVAEVEASVDEAPTPPIAAGAPLVRSEPQPFVGRAEVMRRLTDKLTDAMHGRGAACLISGEAGIGKTRCAEELIARATELGFSAWTGRALEDAGMPSFWPWMQILREAVRQRPQLRTAAERLLARLAASEPAHATLADLQSDANQDALSRRFWLQSELTDLFVSAARSHPLLLMVDDLQWADVGSRKLLEFLTLELPRSRILLVATQREELPRTDACLSSRLARHTERFQLVRLTAADVGSYIAQLTAAGEPPLELSVAVQRATNGNPLFVQETVRGLILEYGPDALGSLAPSVVKMPAVARDVLRARVTGMNPAVRALLSKASVLGESFELTLLQALSDLAADELLDWIEEAVQHGLIVAETPERYRFPHALMRALWYEELSTAERVTLHRRAGEALEASQSVEPRYGEIAHHFYRSLPAGTHGHVVDAALRAGRAAERVLAYDDAARFYDWALEAQALDSSSKPRDRAELLLAFARAQRHAGRRRDARETLRRSIELARQHGYGDLLMRAARMLRSTFVTSRKPDALMTGALDEVLRIANEGANAQRILALSQLACSPPYADDMLRSKRMSEEALELARHLGERSVLLEALRSRLYSLSGPDDVDALSLVANEILELDRPRPTARSVEAHIARIGAFMYRGADAAAEQALAQLGRTAHDLRMPEAIWYYDRQLAYRAYLLGDFAQALEACPELTARSERLGLSYGKAFMIALRAAVGIERQGLVAYLAAADAPSVATVGPNPPRYIRARLLRRSAERGQRNVAQKGVDGFAAQGFETIPKDIGYLNTLANLSFAVVAIGDRERAEQLYALLAPYPQHNTPDVLLFDEGSVSRHLALLAALLGWQDRVEAHFEAALAMNRQMRRAPLIVATCYEYARWLAGLGQDGAASRARALAHEARTSAEALGMNWLAERASALER